MSMHSSYRFARAAYGIARIEGKWARADRRLAQNRPSVVHQDIDRRKLLDRPPHKRINRFPVVHVAGVSFKFPADPRDLLFNFAVR
jgi:hypothetical protein